MIKNLIHYFQLARRGLDLELCTRCAVQLLRSHQLQIITTRSLLDEIKEMQDILQLSVGCYRAMIGINVAGLLFMQKIQQQKAVENVTFADEFPAGKSKKAKKSS